MKIKREYKKQSDGSYKVYRDGEFQTYLFRDEKGWRTQIECYEDNGKPYWKEIKGKTRGIVMADWQLQKTLNKLQET